MAAVGGAPATAAANDPTAANTTIPTVNREQSEAPPQCTATVSHADFIATMAPPVANAFSAEDDALEEVQHTPAHLDGNAPHELDVWLLAECHRSEVRLLQDNLRSVTEIYRPDDDRFGGPDIARFPSMLFLAADVPMASDIEPASALPDLYLLGVAFTPELAAYVTLDPAPVTPHRSAWTLTRTVCRPALFHTNCGISAPRYFHGYLGRTWRKHGGSGPAHCVPRRRNSVGVC